MCSLLRVEGRLPCFFFIATVVQSITFRWFLEQVSLIVGVGFGKALLELSLDHSLHSILMQRFVCLHVRIWRRRI